ncbi:MAG TPA: fumarylacetoacetate hydrolase family protein [Candidatus Sulfomarinibacteraceae bacterium]|nr:fumarylacetoacetate hydrolase family protein [Candidatus Sulfomarinibacteraceae bacterium]
MRLATVVEDGRASVALIRDRTFLPLALPDAGLGSLRGIAASGPDGLRRVHDWVSRQPERAYRPLAEVELGPAVPDPGAIYTIGLNYAAPGEPDPDRPDRPLVYAKLPASVGGHRSIVTWDRALTASVDAEAELGVVIGEAARAVRPEAALRHVFGYTCINDISSRDPWLDGDQWLLGKSLPGFCPVGPWVVTADEIEPGNVRLGCTINGVPIQDGHSAQMRFPVAAVIAYLSRHVTLRPGDLIATGTPARLAGPLGPDRHLRIGDTVTVWIEGIGELTTLIA